MKIDKAIEILTVHTKDRKPYFDPDLHTATKLGLEALKRLKEHREEHIDISHRNLPGETQ